MVVFVFPSRGEEALIFTDDFESGTLAEWDAESDVNDPAARPDDPAHVFRGKYAGGNHRPSGRGDRSGSNKWFMPGYGQVHARWYCQFAGDFDQGNHMQLVHLLANPAAADNKWSAFGKSTGLKPGGADFFTHRPRTLA